MGTVSVLPSSLLNSSQADMGTGTVENLSLVYRSPSFLVLPMREQYYWAVRSHVFASESACDLFVGVAFCCAAHKRYFCFASESAGEKFVAFFFRGTVLAQMGPPHFFPGQCFAEHTG